MGFTAIANISAMHNTRLSSVFVLGEISHQVLEDTFAEFLNFTSNHFKILENLVNFSVLLVSGLGFGFFLDFNFWLLGSLDSLNFKLNLVAAHSMLVLTLPTLSTAESVFAALLARFLLEIAVFTSAFGKFLTEQFDQFSVS